MEIRINRFELDLYLTSSFINVPNLFQAYWSLRDRRLCCFELLTPRALEARCMERGEGYYRTEEDRLRAAHAKAEQEAVLYREAKSKRQFNSGYQGIRPAA